MNAKLRGGRQLKLTSLSERVQRMPTVFERPCPWTLNLSHDTSSSYGSKGGKAYAHGISIGQCSVPRVRMNDNITQLKHFLVSADTGREYSQLLTAEHVVPHGKDLEGAKEAQFVGKRTCTMLRKSVAISSTRG